MVAELLIGIGIALFVVLLAWGNQIRSIQKYTRDLERELIETKNLPWKDIKILTNQNSRVEDKQLSLSRLMKKRKLKSKDLPKLLQLFEKLNGVKENLKEISKSKYNLTFYSILVFLICGGISLLNIKVPFKDVIFSLNILLGIIPFIFILFLLINIFKTNEKEEDFDSIIEDIYDNLC